MFPFSNRPIAVWGCQARYRESLEVDHGRARERPEAARDGERFVAVVNQELLKCGHCPAEAS